MYFLSDGGIRPHFLRASQALSQSAQPQEQPVFRCLIMRRSAKNTAAAIMAIMTISGMLIVPTSQTMPASRPIRRTSRAATHATAHCQITTYSAHLRPSSRRTDATAATQGV